MAKKLTKIAFDQLDSVYVLVMGPAAPPDSEWAQWVEFVTVNSTPGMQPRIVVMTEGGAPTAAQRAALSGVTEQYKAEVKVAVLTESMIARGALTALSWFAADVYRPFSPNDSDKAFHYLDIASKGPQVKDLIRNLQKQLGLPLLREPSPAGGGF
jgi:hypothetical protein